MAQAEANAYISELPNFRICISGELIESTPMFTYEYDRLYELSPKSVCFDKKYATINMLRNKLCIKTTF